MIASSYVVKSRGRIGPAPKYDHSIMRLDRIVERHPDGIYYEADQRHADIIVDTLALDKANAVVTPGGNKQHPKDDTPLSETQATSYRALVARGIHFAPDISDIGDAAK